MSAITTTSNSETIFVKFHFELKDAFRTLFKNAVWSSSTKLWEIKNTPANTQKLQQFINGSQETADALELSDNFDATKAELQELRAKLSKFETLRADAIERKEKFAALNAELAATKVKHAAELTEVKKLHEDSVAEKKSFTTIVDEALKAQGVPAMVSKLQKLWKASPSSQGRREFQELQVDLESAYEDIKTAAKLDLTALWEISDINFNTARHKTSPDDLYAKIYSDAEVIQ